jgi:Lipocalin-like domain
MPSIVGTWKLVHVIARDAAGAARPSPYGGKALGRVTFMADGRMMSVVCDGRKELPAGVSREYSSYCGNYTYDGEKLVTRVDAASDPSRIGSDQVRGVRFEGARMVLIPRRARSVNTRNTVRSPGSASRRNRAGTLWAGQPQSKASKQSGLAL